jgi:hypothetical protein
MTLIAILLVALMSPPAHADSWCSGVVVSNGNCESNLPPVIIRWTAAVATPDALASDQLIAPLSNGPTGKRHRRADRSR